MSENESSALHALRKDSNIVISKPDKGNGVEEIKRLTCKPSKHYSYLATYGVYVPISISEHL